MKLNMRRTRAFVAGLGIVAGTAVGLVGPVATAHAEETPTRQTTATVVDRARSGYDYRCDTVTLYGVLGPDGRGENAEVCKFTKWFIERDMPVDAETAAMMDAAIRQARGLPIGTEYSKRYYFMPQGPQGTFSISFERVRYEVRQVDRYADGRTVEVFRGRAFFLELPNVRYG